MRAGAERLILWMQCLNSLAFRHTSSCSVIHALTVRPRSRLIEGALNIPHPRSVLAVQKESSHECIRPSTHLRRLVSGLYVSVARHMRDEGKDAYASDA